MSDKKKSSMFVRYLGSNPDTLTIEDIWIVHHLEDHLLVKCYGGENYRIPLAAIAYTREVNV